MRARVVLLYALPIVTAVIGYAIGVLIGAPPGADHSCPFNAPPDECRYPPDIARWDLRWTAGGFIVGAVLAVAAWALLRRRSHVLARSATTPAHDV